MVYTHTVEINQRIPLFVFFFSYYIILIFGIRHRLTDIILTHTFLIVNGNDPRKVR